MYLAITSQCVIVSKKHGDICLPIFFAMNPLHMVYINKKKKKVDPEKQSLIKDALSHMLPVRNLRIAW